MKKIYMLALSALAFAVSATAAPAVQLSNPKMPVTEKAKKSTQFHNALTTKLESKLESKFASKAPAKYATQVSDVVGDYELYYYVEFAAPDGGPFTSEMSVTEGSGTNEVIFHVPFENSGGILMWNMVGTLNTSTGDITISKNQSTGFNGASFWMGHYDWDEGDYLEIDQIVAKFNGKAIVFDEDDAMGLQAASGGYYTLFDMITMDKIIDDPNVDPNEGWSSLGNATFIDPWALPGFGEDQEEFPWEVELQQNDANKNIYRLVNPYKGNSPLATTNESTKTGYIQFDVTDPDHVTFEVVSAGFAYAKAGVNNFFCYNQLTYFAKKYPNYSVEEIIEILGDELPYTTFKDGVLTLSHVDTVDEDGPYTVYDATFGLTGVDGAYHWTDNQQNPINMDGRIIFPGAAPSPEYVFNFNVTDNNNKPVANASINFTLNNNNINVTNTDANGKATVSVTGDFSGATYSYTVSGSIDGTVVSTEGQGTVGAMTTDINVTLTPAPKREIALVFNVTDDNEKAIAGAKIEVMEGTTIIATLTTGADGSAKSEVIDDIDGKKLTYTVTAEGYEDKAGSFTVVGYDTTTTPWIYTCDVVMTPVVVETFVVRFNVSDKDKNPVKDASIVITLEDNTIAELRTDAQGIAETEPLEELGGATLDFTVTAANYAEYNGTLVVEGYEGELPYIIEYNVTLNSSKINTVGIDSNNESVRYFNLQGLEISKPEKGQIVIRVANGNVEKTVVK